LKLGRNLFGFMYLLSIFVIILFLSQQVTYLSSLLIKMHQFRWLKTVICSYVFILVKYHYFNRLGQVKTTWPFSMLSLKIFNQSRC